MNENNLLSNKFPVLEIEKIENEKYKFKLTFQNHILYGNEFYSEDIGELFNLAFLNFYESMENAEDSKILIKMEDIIPDIQINTKSIIIYDNGLVELYKIPFALYYFYKKKIIPIIINSNYTIENIQASLNHAGKFFYYYADEKVIVFLQNYWESSTVYYENTIQLLEDDNYEFLYNESFEELALRLKKGSRKRKVIIVAHGDEQGNLYIATKSYSKKNAIEIDYKNICHYSIEQIKGYKFYMYPLENILKIYNDVIQNVECITLLCCHGGKIQAISDIFFDKCVPCISFGDLVNPNFALFIIGEMLSI